MQRTFSGEATFLMIGLVGLVALLVIFALTWLIQHLQPQTRRWLFGGLAVVAVLAMMMFFTTNWELSPNPTHLPRDIESRDGRVEVRATALESDSDQSSPRKRVVADSITNAEAEQPEIDLSETDPDAPDWIKDPEQKRGDAYYVVVHSGEYSDAAMREEMLDVKMVAAAERYIDRAFKGQADVAKATGIDARYLRDNCIAGEYPPAGNASDEKYVQLKFDKRFRDEVKQQYVQYLSNSRAQQLGGVTLGVLGMMAAALAYLKLTKPRQSV